MNIKSTGQNLVCRRVIIENAEGLIQAVNQSNIKAESYCSWMAPDTLDWVVNLKLLLNNLCAPSKSQRLDNSETISEETGNEQTGTCKKIAHLSKMQEDACAARDES